MDDLTVPMGPVSGRVLLLFASGFPQLFQTVDPAAPGEAWLEADGYLSDFVQEECAAICNLNASRSISICTGESAFNMTE